MTFRKLLALGLVLLAAKVNGTRVMIDGGRVVFDGDDEDGDAGDECSDSYDENEEDPTSTYVAGPVALTYDWDGELLNVAVLNDSSGLDKLAGFLMGSHCMLVGSGVRNEYQA